MLPTLKIILKEALITLIILLQLNNNQYLFEFQKDNLKKFSFLDNTFVSRDLGIFIKVKF